MWAVTERFLQALRYPHRIHSTVTVTVPDGDPVAVDMKSGSVTVAGAKGVRRRAELAVVGDSDVFGMITTPGALFAIQHGMHFGGDTELVPVFAGEVTSAVQQYGNGGVTLTLADLGNWLSRCQFVTPYAPGSSTLRVAAIEAVVTTARPGTTVANTSADLGTVGSGQVWSTGPHDVIEQLTKDGGTEAFFLPDGTFLIRDRMTTASTPVWTATAGAAGVISSVARTRPLDRLYNTVVVQPATTDGSQTWTQQTATVTDFAHPRHPLKVGTVPFFFKSPTALSANAASTIARQLLDRVLGTTETLAIQGVANPALEANEPIRVVTPSMVSERAATFQHFIDGFTLDLVTGGMRLDTRSQGVTVDG